MPVNYRVNGGVDITPAIAPREHDWGMLERGIMRGEAYKAKKEAEAQAAQAAKAKQAADEAKYSPDQVNDIEYNNAVNEMGQQVLKYSANSYKNGNIGSPEHNYNIGRLKNETALVAGKGKAAIETYKQAYQNVDQLPKYVDKNLLNTQIYDASHPKTKDGRINFAEIDPKNIAEIPANYYGAINTADMYGEKVKDLGIKVHSTENMFGVADPNDGTALGQMIRSDTTKAKFFKPLTDKKGNVVKWVPGVTDEAAGFMLDNDREVSGEAEARLKEYYQKETAARVNAGDNRDIRQIYQDVERSIDSRKFMRDHVKLNLERLNEVSTDTGLKQGYKYDKPDKGDSEDFSATKMVNQKRNINVRKTGSDVDEVKVGDIAEEYRFSGKKIDTPLLINSSKIIDERTNRAISGTDAVGDKKIFPTRAMLMAYDPKTNQFHHGKTEDQKKNPDLIFKWVLGGNVKDKKIVDGKEVDEEKPVLIPMDEVSNDLKAKFGFDLDQRAPSDISDLELTSIIKQQYPNASPQEKIKIFKSFRAK